MEGEFTRLSQIYGNHLLFLGTNGDKDWENRNTRFLKPFYTDEVLKLKFTISGKEDVDNEYGKIAVDFEGTNQSGEVVVISKKNLYRIKKEPALPETNCFPFFESSSRNAFFTRENAR